MVVATFPLVSLSFLPNNSPTVATFNSATGEINVLTAGAAYSVSASSAQPFSVVSGQELYVSFSCTADSSREVQVELKKRVNPTGAFASQKVVCNGQINQPLTPNQTFDDTRVSVNVGDKVGKVTIGQIVVKKKK